MSSLLYASRMIAAAASWNAFLSGGYVIVNVCGSAETEFENSNAITIATPYTPAMSHAAGRRLDLPSWFIAMTIERNQNPGSPLMSDHSTKSIA